MSKTASSVKIADAPAEVGQEIEAQLLRALRGALPQGENASFGLSATDQHGVVVGGVVARTSYGWLLTKCLWVAEGHCHGGLGRSLMARAEEKAREIGCHGAWLDTSSSGAMSFYSKLGYTSFGQLANGDVQQPPSHRRWFVSRALQKDFSMLPNLRITEVKAFVPATDFELSKRFYQDLGFTMASEGGGVAYFHTQQFDPGDGPRADFAPVGRRPPFENSRKPLSIRLPVDVMDQWKATGPGWQTRMAE